MTGREIIDAILEDAKNLDSEILCKIVYRYLGSNDVSEQTGSDFTIIGNVLIINARRQ